MARFRDEQTVSGSSGFGRDRRNSTRDGGSKHDRGTAGTGRNSARRRPACDAAGRCLDSGQFPGHWRFNQSRSQCTERRNSGEQPTRRFDGSAESRKCDNGGDSEATGPGYF